MRFRQFFEAYSENDFWYDLYDFSLEKFGVLLDKLEEETDYEDIQYLRFFYNNKIYPLTPGYDYYWINGDVDIPYFGKPQAEFLRFEQRNNEFHPWDLPEKVLSCLKWGDQSKYGEKILYSRYSHVRFAFGNLIACLKDHPDFIKLITKNPNKKIKEKINQLNFHKFQNFLSKLHPYYFRYTKPTKENINNIISSLKSFLNSKVLNSIKNEIKKDEWGMDVITRTRELIDKDERFTELKSVLDQLLHTLQH